MRRSDYDSLKEDIDRQEIDREKDGNAIWAKLEKHDERFERHNDRIGVIERWQYFVYGISAAVGVVGTLVMWMISELLQAMAPK